MALIKCNICGRKISDKAEICPQCGEQINAKSARLFNTIYYVSSVSFLLFVFAWIISFWGCFFIPDLSDIFSFTSSLPIVGLYMVCFTIASMRIKNTSRIIALSLLLIGAACYITNWCFLKEPSYLYFSSWLQRILLLITFIILIVKCRAWNVTIALALQIILRIIGSFESIYHSIDPGFFTWTYWLIENIFTQVCYLLSAALFLIPIRKRC